MENASKALIIAGAILLAILLISLGIMIFTQGQEVVNNGGMSEAELQSFNSKLLKYEGKQKGTLVKAMANEIMAVNKDNFDRGSEVAVTINGVNPYSGENFTTSNIKNNTTYEVKLEYKNSRVSNIVVTADNKNVDFGSKGE